MAYLDKALQWVGEHSAGDVVSEKDLLQTPQANLKKPLLIESQILGERFYLVANEAQAREIEREGKVCYLPQEIKTLLVNSAGLDGKSLKDYLGKTHAVKKTFEGARVE